MPGDKFDLMRTGVVEGTIVDYEDSSPQPDQPFCFIVQRLRVVRAVSLTSFDGTIDY